MKKKTKLCSAVAVGFLAALTGGFAGEPETVASSQTWQPLQGVATVQVEDATLTFGDKEMPGQTITLSHAGSSFSNAVVLPLEADMQEYAVISFRVKMQRPAEASDDFGIHLLNEKSWYLTKGSANAGTKFLAHAHEVAPGEYEFSWPITDLLEKFPLSDARFLALIYPVQSIPEGETVQISVSEVSFQK